MLFRAERHFRKKRKTLCGKELQKRAREDSNLQPSDSKSEAVNSQPSQNKALTNPEQSVLASCLAQIVQKYPELEQIITAWPQLPEQVKTTIKELIQTHKTEKE